MVALLQPGEERLEAARALLQRTNGFLTLCIEHAEAALAADAAEELIDAHRCVRGSELAPLAEGGSRSDAA